MGSFSQYVYVLISYVALCRLLLYPYFFILSCRVVVKRLRKNNTYKRIKTDWNYLVLKNRCHYNHYIYLLIIISSGINYDSNLAISICI